MSFKWIIEWFHLSMCFRFLSPWMDTMYEMDNASATSIVAPTLEHSEGADINKENLLKMSGKRFPNSVCNIIGLLLLLPWMFFLPIFMFLLIIFILILFISNVYFTGWLFRFSQMLECVTFPELKTIDGHLGLYIQSNDNLKYFGMPKLKSIRANRAINYPCGVVNTGNPSLEVLDLSRYKTKNNQSPN